MLFHQKTKSEISWYAFIKYLTQREPKHMVLLNKIILEVSDYRMTKNPFRISDSNFALVVFIEKYYKGDLDNLDDLLKFMESCKWPWLFLG